jgi:hypothetical protein
VDGCEVPREEDGRNKENLTVKSRSLFSLPKFVFLWLPIKKSFNPSSSLARAREVQLGAEGAIDN